MLDLRSHIEPLLLLLLLLLPPPHPFFSSFRIRRAGEGVWQPENWVTGVYILFIGIKQEFAYDRDLQGPWLIICNNHTAYLIPINNIYICNDLLPCRGT